LLPYVAQVAAGIRPYLQVWGNDYPTPDGTGVRDYIHVMDLAEGHVAALRYINSNSGLLTVNLGTGRGTSVLEMITAFERVCNRNLPYIIGSRRPGDVASCWADSSLASQLLGWKTVRSLDDMCNDAWNWQQLSQTYN
jgi:UDP-glucose 4-epimerase